MSKIRILIKKVEEGKKATGLCWVEGPDDTNVYTAKIQTLVQTISLGGQGVASSFNMEWKDIPIELDGSCLVK